MMKIFQSDQPANPVRLAALVRHLLTSWEIYLILFVGAFLRLVNIDTAIFFNDEVGVFRLAHDAIISGWLPLTSNRASLGNLNPPLVVYFFMLPASISANPLWGQVMVALFNIAAVLLTYFFVRRYYGRLAGTIAALLYATSAGVWTFSRNIWPQNFLTFFVILFMFALFRGVVERRKGWLFWAILLIGVLYQFHGSSLYLLIPLAAAVLFAFKTIRLRDIVMGAVALVVLFAPYILWEIHVHFSDVIMLFSTAQQQAQIDTQALHFYLFYLHPTLVNPYLDPAVQMRDTHTLVPDSHSVLSQHYLSLLMTGMYLLSILLLLGGILLAIIQIFAVRPADQATESKKKRVIRWWNEFRSTPSRQGLALLLLWQIAPLLLLTRHSIVLFVHYFLFFLPGQFILMALCIVQLIALAKRYRPAWDYTARYVLSALAVLVILAQLIGVGGAIIDISAGHFQSAVFTDLHDTQNALQVADQVAQQRHIHRIYVMSFPPYQIAPLVYLSERMKTPVELLDSANCFILPSPAVGPVVLLTTPGDSLANTMLRLYANAAVVAAPPHLPDAPYQIYVLKAKPEPAPLPRTFSQGLQLLSPTAQLLRNAHAHLQWLTTRWSVHDDHSPAFRTSYGFHFQMRSVGEPLLNDNLDCTPTSTWAGDQLFVFHSSANGDVFPSQVTLRVSTFVSQPQTLSLGPVRGFTYYNDVTDWQTLLTDDRKSELTLPVLVAS